MSEARFACFPFAPRARLFGFIIMAPFIFEGAYHDLQPEGLSPPERSEHNLPPLGGHNPRALRARPPLVLAYHLPTRRRWDNKHRGPL